MHAAEMAVTSFFEELALVSKLEGGLGQSCNAGDQWRDFGALLQFPEDR